MSLDNQISIALTQAELDTIDQALADIEGVLDGKLISLTPKQSRIYGRLGNETENFTNMVFQDIHQDANVKPSFIEIAEWEKDVAARGALIPRLTRMEGLTQRIHDTTRMIGFDIYTSSLAVYNNAKYLASRNQGSAKTYYEKWKVQFPGNRRPAVAPTVSDGETASQN